MSYVYNQSKLSKTEWCSIEVPLPPSEINILNLIKEGFNNVNIRINKHISLCDYLKVGDSREMSEFLYLKYFAPIVDQIQNIPFTLESVNPKITIKKADQIRLNRFIDSEESNKTFEFVLIDYLAKCTETFEIYRQSQEKSSAEHVFATQKHTHKKKKSQLPYPWIYYYYTLYILSKSHISNLNCIVVKIIRQALEYYASYIDISSAIFQSVNIFEKNKDLITYEDMRLYEHQQRVFTLCKSTSPKLILYSAPTGTGKTLTPIGISEQYKIIFVCAARHVGLALAKAAISIGKKTAFAFGCTSAGDIRLHYYSAKDYDVNKRSGGIGKIDNSVGDKVEIIISDIQSYIYAMYYMCAFNDPNNLVTYWDEPTIAMDYETHELHETMRNNWEKNCIPNVVLSSATLPHEHEILDVIENFKEKFPDATIETVTSHDCRKTIPLIETDGTIFMPHNYESYDTVNRIATHCINNPVLLRYLDLSEIVRFLKIIESAESTNNTLIQSRFDSIKHVTLNNIKLHYLDVLCNISSEKWGETHNKLVETASAQLQDYGGHISTKCAYTLTNGPTLFMANNVQKISAFCIQEVNIPQKELDVLTDKIESNGKLAKEIEKLEHELESIAEQAVKTEQIKSSASKIDGTKSKSKGKHNKLIQSNMDNDKDPRIRKIQSDIDTYTGLIRSISLNGIHIPNHRAHIERWASGKDTTNAFVSDVSEEDVVSIMRLTVDNSWKLLLLLGIGVFSDHKNREYTEIVKKLADDQKLYLIIANSDYIYGTNYQFCHGYIGKDLDATQEKITQAIGRIGRNSMQNTYSVRFRDNNHIQMLVADIPAEEKMEIVNMNKLWGISA
jgi:hypothetical protein